jgi:gas vesicle protein
MEMSWNPSRILYESSSTASTILQAFGAGVLLGAGIALLLAPKTGEEMRREIGRRLSFDRNREFADKVREEGGLPGPFKHLAP